MSTIINPPAKMLPENLMERLKRLDPALLCDGMAGLNLPQDGCMAASIKPIASTMRIFGPALTVETGGGDNFPIHIATYSAAAGYVMVVDGKACEERAYAGALIAGAARAVGILGLVIDGYARDRRELEELGLPVYCRGLTQRGPLKKSGGVINGPINCGGVRVEPGDLVMGDADGVTVVPALLLEEIVGKAEKKMAYEEARREVIAQYSAARQRGETPPQLAPAWVLDMLEAVK